MSKTTVSKDEASNTLIIERLFSATRDDVWQAWTSAATLAKWWGPQGWQTTIKRYEFEPGGVWLYGMKCVDKAQAEFFGQEAWGKATFSQIDAPCSFIYKDEFSDAEGVVSPDMPVMTVTMDFIEEGDKTRVRSVAVADSQEGFDKILAMGAIDGLTETWDRLEALLSQNH